MEGGHIDRRIGGRAASREDLDGADQQLLAPLANLVGMELETLGELGQRDIAFQCREGDFGLEGRGVIATGTTGHDGSGEVSERSLRKPACLQSVLSEGPGPLLWGTPGPGRDALHCANRRQRTH